MQEIPHHLTDLEPVVKKPFMGRTLRYSLFGILIVVTAGQIVVQRLLFIKRLTIDEFEMIRATFFAVVSAVFSIPLMALVLASLISLIPIKSYTYKQRFWPIALVTILALQSLVLASSLYTWYIIASTRTT